MAFNRSIDLEIGQNGTGLLISDLDIGFNISRSRTFAENTADITVFNASEDTRKKILKPGNNLVFKFGYEDEPKATLFVGSIVEASSEKNGSVWESKILAATVQNSGRPLENTYVSLSFGPGVSLIQPIRAIGAALQLIVYGEETANVIMDNGLTFVGSARAALKHCNDILSQRNVRLYMDNNSIVIFNKNGESRFSPVYLDYNSGLLSVEDITEITEDDPKPQRRLSFTSLIHPKLQPDMPIQIVSDSVNGVFVVEKIQLSGDNFGGDCRCSGEVFE